MDRILPAPLSVQKYHCPYNHYQGTTTDRQETRKMKWYSSAIFYLLPFVEYYIHWSPSIWHEPQDEYRTTPLHRGYLHWQTRHQANDVNGRGRHLQHSRRCVSTIYCTSMKIMSCRWHCHTNILRPRKTQEEEPKTLARQWHVCDMNMILPQKTVDTSSGVLETSYSSILVIDSTIACGHCRHPPGLKADVHPLNGFSVSCLPRYTIKEHFLIFENISYFFFSEAWHFLT